MMPIPNASIYSPPPGKLLSNTNNNIPNSNSNSTSNYNMLNVYQHNYEKLMQTFLSKQRKTGASGSDAADLSSLARFQNGLFAAAAAAAAAAASASGGVTPTTLPFDLACSGSSEEAAATSSSRKQERAKSGVDGSAERNVAVASCAQFLVARKINNNKQVKKVEPEEP